MKCLKILEPNHAVVVEAPTPVIGSRELLVRVMASGICGTDIHIFRGSYLGPYPVVPGHEFAGVVTEIGKDVSRFAPGDSVAVEPNIACNNCLPCLENRQNFCLNWQAIGVTRPGSMAEYVSVPENAAFAIGDLSFAEGAFVEPLSCVLHGIQKLHLQPGARVAVIGAGPIGLLMLQCLRLRGAAHITAVDRQEARLELAARAGTDRALISLADLETDTYDLVVDATGSISVMEKTLAAARPGGTVLWFGVPPSGESMQIEPFTIFRKGLSIVASFTSVRNSTRAVDLLGSGKIKVKEIISHSLPLRQFEKAVEMIEKAEDGVRKVMILPNA